MLCFVLIFVLFLSGINAEEQAEDSLVLIHAFIRHGDRTPDPITIFPNDLYRNFDYYPFGQGELNMKGRIRSYQFGKKLKKRYEKFLGSTYDSSMVFPMSSESHRCRMTMQLLLAAMFPPNLAQAVNKKIPWQPIPIKYVSCKIDQILCYKVCYNLLLSTQLNEKVSLCRNRTFLNEYLTEKSGTKIKSPASMMSVLDTLKSQTENNLPLPKWAESIYPEPLTTCSHDIWRCFLLNDTTLATAVGPSMRKIMRDTDDKIKGLLKNKLMIYTAHDYNIFLFLSMLKHYKNQISNYLDSLIFEVHQIDDVYGFKIFYEHHDGNGFQQLKIPNCGMFCPVDKFRELMQFYLKAKPCQ